MVVALTMEAAAPLLMAVQGLHCTAGAGQVLVVAVWCGQEHLIQSHAGNENATVWSCQLVTREDQHGVSVW